MDFNRPSSPHDRKLLIAKFEQERKRAVWLASQEKWPLQDEKKPKHDKAKRLVKYASWG